MSFMYMYIIKLENGMFKKFNKNVIIYMFSRYILILFFRLNYY